MWNTGSDPPRLLREQFRRAPPRTGTGTALAAGPEDFRDLYERIEKVRRAPRERSLYALADACVKSGALARDAHGRFERPEALDFQATARHALAELLMIAHRGREDRRLALDQLEVLPPTGWIRAYLECLEEGTDPEGRPEVAVLRGLSALHVALGGGGGSSSEADAAPDDEGEEPDSSRVSPVPDGGGHGSAPSEERSPGEAADGERGDPEPQAGPDAAHPVRGLPEDARAGARHDAAEAEVGGVRPETASPLRSPVTSRSLRVVSWPLRGAFNGRARSGVVGVDRLDHPSDTIGHHGGVRGKPSGNGGVFVRGFARRFALRRVRRAASGGPAGSRAGPQ